MAAVQDFLRQNIPKGTALNLAIFGPSYVKQYSESESKLKAIVKIMADWYFWTAKLLAPMRTFFIGGATVLGFKAIGDAIKAIVRDTGSLAAALQRLQNIQISERQIAPFVGGLGAAKQRIAELVTLSTKGPFKFEEIAQANHSLEIFTRGAYSSADATRKIGAAAVASGNDITTVADAVGEFYQNLREGQPIAGTAEKLRQLGVISQATVTDLQAMEQAGVGSIEMFNRLTTAVENSTKGVKSVKDDLATVTAEHEKAAQELQRQFGAPWTAADIQNTKNMTAAMQAIAPTVRRVSASLEGVFDGFTTAKTAIISFAAKSETVRNSLEGIIKGFASLATAALLFGTVASAFLIPKILATGTSISVYLLPQLAKIPFLAKYAAEGATLLGNAFKLIGVGGVVGLVIAGAVAITGAIMGQIQIFRRAGNESRQMADAFTKSNKAIQEQIGNVKTLTEYHEALIASMNNVVAAHGALAEARQKDADDLAAMNDVVRTFTILARNLPRDIKHPSNLLKPAIQGGPREKAVFEAEAQAEKTERRAALMTTAGLAGPERQRMLAQKAEEFTAEQQQRLERQLVSAGPTQRIPIQREQAKVMEIQAEQGRRGLRERARIEQETSGIEKRRVEVQKNVQKAIQDLADPVTQRDKKEVEKRKKIIETSEKELTGIEAKFLQVRLGAQEGTAIKQEARMEQLRHAIAARAAGKAGKPKEEARQRELAGGEEIKSEAAQQAAIRELQTLEISAQVLKNRESQATALSEGAKMLAAQVTEEERLLAITKSRVDADAQISALRLKAALEGKAAGDTAREEYEIRKRQLETEIALEKQRGTKVLTKEETTQVEAYQKRIEELKAGKAPAPASAAAPGAAEPQKVTIDTEEAENKIVELQKQINSITATHEIKPKISTEEAEAGIKELEDQIKKIKAPELVPLTDEQFNDRNLKIAELKRQASELPPITAATPPGEEADIRKQEATIKSKISTLEQPEIRPKILTDDAKKQIDELQTKIIQIHQKQYPTQPLLSDEEVAKIKGLQEQIDKLRSPQPITPKVETDDAKAKIADLEKAIEAIKGPTAGGDPAELKKLEDQKDLLRLGEVDRVRRLEVARQEADISLEQRVAEREGRSEEAIALKNQEEFMQRMEQHRGEGMDEEESRRRAMAETEESIREQVIPGGPRPVAGELTRIGGGGGVYAPGGDPTLQTQKQIATLIVRSNEYLKILTGKGEGVQ